MERRTVTLTLRLITNSNSVTFTSILLTIALHIIVSSHVIPLIEEHKVLNMHQKERITKQFSK